MKKIIAILSIALSVVSHQVSAELSEAELQEASDRYHRQMSDLENQHGLKYKDDLSFVVQKILQRKISTIEDGIYRIDKAIFIRNCGPGYCIGTMPGTSFVFELVGFNDLLQGTYFEPYQFHRMFVKDGRFKVVYLSGELNEF